MDSFYMYMNNPKQLVLLSLKFPIVLPMIKEILSKILHWSVCNVQNYITSITILVKTELSFRIVWLMKSTKTSARCVMFSTTWMLIRLFVWAFQLVFWTASNILMKKLADNARQITIYSITNVSKWKLRSIIVFSMPTLLLVFNACQDSS